MDQAFPTSPISESFDENSTIVGIASLFSMINKEMYPGNTEVADELRVEFHGTVG